MTNDLLAILPELIVIVGGLILLVLPKVRSARFLSMATLILLAAAGDLALVQMIQNPFPRLLFYGMFLKDRLSCLFQLAILVFMGLVILNVAGNSRDDLRSRKELYALLLFAAAGLLFVVGAQHLALIYVGLELVSLTSYLLTGLNKRSALAVEGGLKYFLFGSLATGAMLYGISLLYGLTGSMELSSLAAFRQKLPEAPLLGSLALLLLVVGFGFKVALVPFHMWAPDAYEGASTPVTAFLSVAPKLAGFAVLVRVFHLGFSPEVAVWSSLLSILSILTMTVGNIAALVQTNIKRLLAYSSIAQAGFMVLGLGLATPLGLTATLYYLVAYLLMNAGAFAGAIYVGNLTGREDLRAFTGLARTQPLAAFMVAVSFLSLAGIPPMAGFFAKMWIFGAAIQAGAMGLAVVAAANSVIALFYYMKVVRYMYLEGPAAAAAAAPPRALLVALGVSTVGLLVVGLLPGPWLVFSADSLPIPFRPVAPPWL